MICRNCGSQIPSFATACPICNEKQEMETLDYDDFNMSWWKHLILACALFFGSSVLAALMSNIIVLVQHIDVNTMEETVQSIQDICSVTSYIILLIGIILMYRKPLWAAIKRIKKPGIFRNSIYYLVCMYFFVIVYNLMITKLHLEATSSNQDNVNAMIFDTPVLGCLYTCLLAPIMEEIIFRLGLFRGLEKRIGAKKALIITTLCFALIHMLASVVSGTLLDDLVSLPIYLIGAFYLTYAYYKSKSLISSTIMHMAYNIIGYVMILITASL